jgi:trimeric autotransporter adhesin
MAPSLPRGRRPKGKIKLFSEWKAQQPSNRDKSREAYDQYRARYYASRNKRAEEQEARAVAEAIARVEAAKAAEQPLLGMRDWAKQQPPGADKSSSAYAQYKAGWNEAQAALVTRAAAGGSSEEKEGDDDDDEEELDGAAAAAAAAARAAVQRAAAYDKYGSLFKGAYKKKEPDPRAGGGSGAPAAASGSAAGSSSSSSSSPSSSSSSAGTEGVAALALVNLRLQPPVAAPARKAAPVPKERLAVAAKEFLDRQKAGLPVSKKGLAEKHDVNRSTLRRYIDDPNLGKRSSM